MFAGIHFILFLPFVFSQINFGSNDDRDDSDVRQNDVVCRTNEEGPNRNAICIFPFIYERREYNGCTNVNDKDGKYWCSTRVDRFGNHVVKANEWGYCDQNCRNHEEVRIFLFDKNPLFSQVFWPLRQSESESSPPTKFHRDYGFSSHTLKRKLLKQSSLNRIFGQQTTCPCWKILDSKNILVQIKFHKLKDLIL